MFLCNRLPKRLFSLIVRDTGVFLCIGHRNMENEIDKRKHTPRRMKFPLGFLALLSAVALCLIFREVVLSTRGSPMPCQGDIFYHLLILTHNPPLQFVLWLSVILLC